MNYDDENRGKVQFPKRFKQPLLFDGMRSGRITPTDIDAMAEYHDRFFILFEVKRQGVEMSEAQRLCLKRCIDAFETSGKDALLVECHHNVFDPSSPVFLKDTYVKKAYWKGNWYEVHRKVTAGEAWTESMEYAKRKESEGNK